MIEDELSIKDLRKEADEVSSVGRLERKDHRRRRRRRPQRHPSWHHPPFPRHLLLHFGAPRPPPDALAASARVAAAAAVTG